MNSTSTGIMLHTPGPWSVWRGPQYVGGGEDICIGHGEKWIANMDHREPRCPEILNSGHFDNDACSICSIDSARISEEQLANALLIASAPELLEALRYAFENLPYPDTLKGNTEYDKARMLLGIGLDDCSPIKTPSVPESNESI